ncbi:MAG: hypothetical protein ABT17_11345 [Rhodanobacter sp. SCN 69-32]|nr:MAG: hypothetical protein ABT17_11345 [Rhodanobacter sp. SCN 69-32]
MMRYPIMFGVMVGLIGIDLHATNRIDRGCPRAGVDAMSVVVGARVVMVGVHASSRDNGNGLTLIGVSIRVVSEGGSGAVVGNKLDNIGLDAAVRQLHARRAGRHARHDEALGIGLFSQQPLDVQRRHMTFDEIAAHFGGMARALAGRNADATFHRIEIVDIAHVDAEAGSTHMVDPRAATSTCSAFVYQHDRKRCVR